MSNVTLSLDPDLVRKCRQYAGSHRTTLNAMIRRLLRQAVENENTLWLDEYVALADSSGGDSRGRSWKREDLYDA
ncbi:MAG: DUF6364 family protein [Acidobacteriota bacterium]